MQTSAFILRITQRLTAAGLLSLGLACGSASQPIGESQQPISGDGSENSGDDACAGGVAPADAAPGECTITGRMLCFSSREAACACAGCGLEECAIAESFPEQAICPSSGNGSGDPDSPVSDDPDGPVSSEPGGGSSGSPGNGGTEPGQPGGGSDGDPGDPGCGFSGDGPGACDAGHAADADGRCDFIVGDACFDRADSACACAGCELAQCAVLESYPAQVRCL